MSPNVGEQTRDSLAADARAKFDACLSSSEWTRLVLSAEGLSTLPIDGLVKLRDWLSQHCDQVIVLLCLRQPFDLRLSLIQQHLKTGATIADELRVLGKPGLFRKTAERIGKGFGSENIQFLIFEEMLAREGGLPGAFAKEIGLSPGLVMPLKQGHLNQSMSLRACLTLDALNQKVPLYVDRKVNPQRSPRVEQMIRDLRGPRFALARVEAEQMRAAVEDDMAFADALFGRRVWNESLPCVADQRHHVWGVRATVLMARLLSRVYS